MKKNIVKIIALFAMFVSVNAFGQTAGNTILVKVTSATDGARLNSIQNGKVTGTSKEYKAYIVTPTVDDKATIAKLEAEIKALLPTATIIRKEEK
ncbi:MAG: hypothetical protein M0D57_02510 [Sphingobacteriales bacterium JAD_PAG50586_3]|nr:MAG: hypothetical protein M0D57_02510 [Sphingobacteriales bacterium JAD_PAG50586_3]